MGNETKSPYEKAGLLSKLTFTWIGFLITKGKKNALDFKDIPPLSSKDNVNETYMIFKNRLESSKDKKATTLLLVKSLFCTARADIIWSALFALIYVVASYFGPYLIKFFVQYLDGQRDYKNQGWVLVSGFFVAKIVEGLSLRQRYFMLQIVGIRTKSVVMEGIYRKALTLSCRAKQGQSSGEMINLMAVDADRIGDFSNNIHDSWMVIVQLGLAMTILYKSLGLASFASLASIVGLMVLNYPISSLIKKYQRRLMQTKDMRMKATSEVLKNMRILKFQAWEMKFLSKIVQLRNTENGLLKRYLYTIAAMNVVFYFTPTIVSVVTFGTCSLIGVPLESGKILSALATFKVLQDPIYSLPDTISQIIQTKVSLDRVASFLCLDDIDRDIVEKLPKSASKEALTIEDGQFSWDPSGLDLVLKDINVKVETGMKVAVCGTVGSGKSTFLSCILGEVPKIYGVIRLSGSTAYVPQSPWIQSGTIADNIIFGSEMDDEKYDSVLESCALKKDFEFFSFGDQTVIGERGINLSGGQKQRIQIARALYQDADIYLFDDPFSALDAHTGSHLFKECLLKLLKSKTVIYVTHQVEFLTVADLILVMKDGKILQAGKYDDILASGTDFIELVGAHEQALSKIDSTPTNDPEPEILECHSRHVSIDGELTNDPNISNPIAAKQLVEDEERVQGKVAFSVYWKYITASYRGSLAPLILLFIVSFQILQILANYWMAWATPASSKTKPPVNTKTLLTVYVYLSLASTVCVLGRSTLIATASFKTATILFSKMHSCIFRAPMSFFDATPTGRILSRVSTDQTTVDVIIAFLITSFASSISQILLVIILMTKVAWEVFLIFFPVAAICVWYQQYYIPSARELSRLIGVTKAPVIQHFSETISGATTIRSFDQEKRFCEKSMECINGYSKPKFYTNAAMQWLATRLDLLSSLIFVCSLIVLILIPLGVIHPGVAGLAVTYGLNLNNLLGFGIKIWSSMENQIISVERILQYTKVESEPPLVIEENRPDTTWPSLGEVEIQDLQIRYAPHLPLVLKGISCTFRGGKKSGIVGRTGSGKSTLIQALFRIVEPAFGQIIIDGVNISTIGLHDLRSKLSIIPQDPTMFEGTVRSNLDPLEEYTDDQIWEALDKCQLGEEVRKKEGKLDSPVTENGENWSMGQRQLVCLGRVLLKKSKVLVLDEATASVDTQTDNLIQQTLQDQFSDSTVVIIAHRITSVIDSDTVLFLNQGLVEECDSPLKLLEDKSSEFSKLVAEYTSRSSSIPDKKNSSVVQL